MTGSAPKVAAALLLFGLLFRGPLAAPDPGAAIRVDAASSIPELVQALTTSSPRLVYADARPPSGALASVLAGAEVEVTTPGRAPALELHAPPAPVAGRRAALTLTVRGAPDERRAVEIESPGGIVDTVSVVVGPESVVRTRIGIEPGRAGASSWTARAIGTDTSEGGQATARSWVGPGAPVRVLVLTGPPGLESRHLARALEAAGAHVEVLTDLGRDLGVATDDAVAPRSPDDLEGFDVVALVEPVDAPVEMLTRWVVERGGGLLRVTPGASGSSSGGTLRWGGPAEILPLPERDAGTGPGRAELWPGAAHARTVDVLLSDDDVPLARAGWLGRGRLYVTTLPTWTWVMEGGQEVQHRRHWESVVEWLAGGFTGEDRLMSGRAIAGVAWVGRIDGEEPRKEPLVLRAPSGSSVAERSTLHPVDGTVRALPRVAGAYTLHDESEPEGDARLGFVAAPSDAPMTWPDAALLIGGAGGSIVSGDGADDATSAAGSPLGTRTFLRALLFLLLAAVVGGGWAARRISGLT